MDDVVYVHIDVTLAESMVTINPQIYRKYVTTVYGKKILYVRVRKALYGCLKSGLLFWQHLSNVLEQMGFQLNPYDTCVANKIIDGSQCTIVWHVDDLKISHAKQSVVDHVISLLEKTYGKMSTQRGTKLSYLGMTLDYSIKSKVIIDMTEYVERLLNDTLQDITEPRRRKA